MDLGSLSNLRHLSVTIFGQPDLPNWLLRLLATAPEINKVQELNITVFFSDFTDAAWGEIDTILTEPRFAQLRVISLRYWGKKGQRSLPEQRFPALLSRGIFLVFNESDRVFPNPTQ